MTTAHEVRQARRHTAAIATVAVAAVALSGAIAGLRGALGIPRNDDWTYYVTTFRTARSGGLFAPDQWTTTFLLGQTTLARPVVAVVGDSRLALQLLVMVLAVVTLTAIGVTVRRFLSLGWTLAVIVLVAVGPIFGTLSASFMSDIPAMCFEALGLWALIHALRPMRISMRWWWLMLVFGLVGFTIREYAVAVPVTAVVCLLIQRGRKLRSRDVRLAVGATILVQIVAAGLYVWRDSFPGPHRTTAASVTLKRQLSAPFAEGFTLALQLAPVVVLLIALVVSQVRRHPRRLLAVIPVAIVIGAAYAYLTRRATVVLGNYLAQTPSYSQTLTGSAPDIFSGSVWQAVNLGAGLCGLVIVLAVALPLAGSVTARISAREGPGVAADVGRTMLDDVERSASVSRLVCASFVVVMFVSVAGVYRLTGGVVYDRYLLPIVPFAAAVLIDLALRTHAVNSAARIVFGAGLIGWAACSIFVVDAAAANDGARWQLAADVAARGVPAAEIDGGYEWFGIHQAQPPGQLRAIASDVPFWEGLFSPRPVCALVSYAGPVALPEAATDGAPELSRTVRLLDGQRLTFDAFDLRRGTDGRCPVLAP
ncbi:glycosyltransferase family 39 protein [Rudaeicoccus suwonensis]|uniref:Dolichyl-phosphate-mannose-protein mannosyltransferase n=1 Tax=Rudaeicoccus suwonensis TaxID=657409 RepID=A0A561E8U8_9MICO|nr:glycosyltransferase family 39 protein [Rudaeicoccus suwonensis]TWE12031.1 dolichyl-phosphate-mannose-protein mannosyltransferase [Rudaeicoccus suwonensis]